MCEEKLTLEKIIEKETENIEKKYDKAEYLLEDYPKWKVKKRTEIDMDILELMNLKRKKSNQIKELEKEISDLEYEIGYNMGFEIGKMKVQYKFAKVMIKKNLSIDKIASESELEEDQVKKLLQTI